VPRGAGHLRDEWSGMIGLMQAHSRDQGANEKGFWLETYDFGDTSADRVGRGDGDPIIVGEKHVMHLSGVQPSKLRKLGNQIDLTSDGYLQRYAPIWIRPLAGGLDQPVGRELADYQRLIEYLAEVEGGQTYKPSYDALRIREHLDADLDRLAKN